MKDGVMRTNARVPAPSEPSRYTGHEVEVELMCSSSEPLGNGERATRTYNRQ